MLAVGGKKGIHKVEMTGIRELNELGRRGKGQCEG